MEKKNTVTQERIEQLLKAADVEYTTIGDKTTLVRVVLENGYELIETSSCVDPANYDEEIGRDCAMSRIIDKLWELEGYVLANELHRARRQVE